MRCIMIESVIWLIAGLAVLGLILWGVSQLPFIAEPMKQIIKVILVVVAGILVIYFLVDILHAVGVLHSSGPLRKW